MGLATLGLVWWIKCLQKRRHDGKPRSVSTAPSPFLRYRAHSCGSPPLSRSATKPSLAIPLPQLCLGLLLVLHSPQWTLKMGSFACVSSHIPREPVHEIHPEQEHGPPPPPARCGAAVLPPLPPTSLSSPHPGSAPLELIAGVNVSRLYAAPLCNSISSFPLPH